MRGYWLKIIGGAVGIFAIGMLGITAFRSVKSKVTSVISSADPIPIPLAGLVPFRLDQERLGSLNRLEILRSDPEHISGVRVLVSLDSAAQERLSRCVISIDDVDNIDENTTFRCQAPESVSAGLERFGTVVIKNGSDSFPLLLPAKAVADLRQTSFEVRRGNIRVRHRDQQVREAMAERTQAMRDELETRIDARSDSVDALADQSQELEDSATAAPMIERRKLQRSADSVRAVMRKMVDRMKFDEYRLQALDDLSEMPVARRDSLALLGTQIADSVRRALGTHFNDSVQRMVARELQRVQADLEKAGVVPPAPTAVEAPAPPKPPARPK